MHRKLFLTGALLVLGCVSSCTSQQDKTYQQMADEMPPCEKLNAFVNGYENGYERIRGRSLSEKYIGVWAARIHAIGKDCQIWQSSQDITYMCSRSAPNKDVVMEWYQNSLAEIQQCITDWQKNESTDEQSGVTKVVWSKQNTTPVVAMQAVPVTRSLRSGRWTLYYYVGSHNELY